MNTETQPIQLVPPRVRVPVASYGIAIVVLRAEVVFEPAAQPNSVLDVEESGSTELRSAA